MTTSEPKNRISPFIENHYDEYLFFSHPVRSVAEPGRQFRERLVAYIIRILMCWCKTKVSSRFCIERLPVKKVVCRSRDCKTW